MTLPQRSLRTKAFARESGGGGSGDGGGYQGVVVREKLFYTSSGDTLREKVIYTSHHTSAGETHPRITPLRETLIYASHLGGRDEPPLIDLGS